MMGGIITTDGTIAMGGITGVRSGAMMIDGIIDRGGGIVDEVGAWWVKG